MIWHAKEKEKAVEKGKANKEKSMEIIEARQGSFSFAKILNKEGAVEFVNSK